jgi:hypothetical protein
MEHSTHYGTVTEALTALKQQGFTIDFNIEANGLVGGETRFTTDEFSIVDVYRYEGNSDPADEATVYAIESKTGVRGVLVTGYGMSSDSLSDAILRKLH